MSSSLCPNKGLPFAVVSIEQTTKQSFGGTYDTIVFGLFTSGMFCSLHLFQPSMKRSCQSTIHEKIQCFAFHFIFDTTYVCQFYSTYYYSFVMNYFFRAKP